MKQFKNDKERMEFVKNNDNWKPNHTGLLETRELDFGTKKFIRIVGKVKDQYDLRVKLNTIDQFEIVSDKDGCHLEHRSNGEIAKAIRECKDV